MSNYRFVSTILLSLMIYFVGGCSEEKPQVVVPEDISIDLKSLPPLLLSQTRGNADCEVNFRIHNTSARQLHLAVGDVSCSCVSAQLDDEILVPNETIRGCIRVSGPFNAGEKHIGCTLKVTGSDKTSMSVPIRTSFRILNDIECRPTVIAVGLAHGHTDGVRQLEVVTRSVDKENAILTLSELLPGIRLNRLERGQAQSLTERIRETTWNVELAFELDTTVESSRGRINLEFDGERSVLPFSVCRFDGIQVIPDVVSVRTIDLENVYRRKVVIRASDSVPFQLLAVQNKPSWVQMSPIGTASSVLHVLELTVDGKTYLERRQDIDHVDDSKLILETTHPKTPQIELKLSLPAAAL